MSSSPIPITQRIPEGHRVNFVLKDDPITYSGRIRGFIPQVNHYIIELDNQIKNYPYSCVIQPFAALIDPLLEASEAAELPAISQSYQELMSLHDDQILATLLGSFLEVPKTALHRSSSEVNIFLDKKPLCLPASERYHFPSRAAAIIAFKMHIINLFKKLYRSDLFRASQSQSIYEERDRIFTYLLTTNRLEFRSAELYPSQSEVEAKSKRDFWSEKNSLGLTKIEKKKKTLPIDNSKSGKGWKGIGEMAKKRNETRKKLQEENGGNVSSYDVGFTTTAIEPKK